MDVILKVQTDDRVPEAAGRIVVAVKDRTPEPAVGVADQKIVGACKRILRGVPRWKTAVELDAVDIHAPLHSVATPGERHVVNVLKRVDAARVHSHSLSDSARPIADADGSHLGHTGHKIQ